MNNDIAGSDLSGEVALVTGASAGLGRHFATLLCERGCTVVAAARRLDRLSALADDLRGAQGSIVPLALDISKHDAIPPFMEAVVSRVGLPTILVNNAASTGVGYATRLPAEDVDLVIRTNIGGPFLLAREVAAQLIAQRRTGRIVNISSVVSSNYGPSDACALYSVTKAALERMTEVLAVEWARFGINVNAIAPGLIGTDMATGLSSSSDDAVSRFPRQRVLAPDSLDSTLLFLVSPGSGGVTGAVVRVDDGQYPR